MKKTIFEYDNYREFLRDFYFQAKLENDRFSYRFFSKQAGFKSQSVLQKVMDGERNLSNEAISKFAKALKLNKEQSTFFKNLVLFNQAKSTDDKQHYAEELLRSRKLKKIYPLKQTQFNYYSRWYLIPLREVICLPDFKNDPNWIAKKLIPPITPMEAKRGLEELLKLGLVLSDPNGKLVQADALVSTGDEVISSAVAQFHKHMMKLAGESIDRTPKQERDISSQTIGITVKTASKIKEMIQKFRKEIMDVVYQDEGVEIIYQINFQLFPISTPSKKGPS